MPYNVVGLPCSDAARSSENAIIGGATSTVASCDDTHTGPLPTVATPQSTYCQGWTAAAPLAAEIETYPGVHAASARLAGGRDRPVLHLTVATEDRADIAALRERIDTEALPRLRQALDLDHLDAELVLDLDHARGSRV